MSPKPLPPSSVEDWLANHPEWQRTDAPALRRDVQAPSFLAGIQLVDDVAQAAEAMDHHPDIDIRWRTVTFTLSTHSVGGLTELDLRLAERIDQLTASLSGS